MSRIVVCAVLFAASCLLVGQRPGPVMGQDKKQEKKTIAALEKQIAALRQNINQGDKQLAALRNANAKLTTENNRLNGLIKKDKKGDDKDDKTTKSLQTALDGYRGAGLIHVVILKLKEGSSDSEVQSVIDDTYSQLAKIKTVRGAWAGKPVSKGGTPDASTDYTVALVLVFDDADGLKTYLNDSAHTKFADKHLKKWETPVVYDIEPKKAAP